MELDSDLETHVQPAAAEPAKLSIPVALGLLQLVWAASVYVTFGISTYPRQEWLIETLAGGIFLIPALRLLLKHGAGPQGTAAVRLVGLALLAHSVWDALHWPGAAFIATPIDSWIPEVCPLLNIPLGAYLLARGK